MDITKINKNIRFFFAQLKNATVTKFFKNQTVRKVMILEWFKMVALSVTIYCRPNGTDLLALREIVCHTSVFLHTTAVPKPQDGFEEDIRRFMMEWCQEQCAITGSTTAAGGVIIFL